jgi:hypothetical protein
VKFLFFNGRASALTFLKSDTGNLFPNLVIAYALNLSLENDIFTPPDIEKNQQ